MIRFILLGWVLALTAAAALTLWAYVFVCLGLPPESIRVADRVAPVLGAICGAALAGAHSRRSAWGGGLAVGVLLVASWLAAWCYLVGRGNPRLWWSQGVCGLTAQHGIEWFLALLVGLSGGRVGGWLRGHGTRAGLALGGVVVLALPVTMSASALAGRWADRPVSPEPSLIPGMKSDRKILEPDGTTVRLLQFDFAAEPGLRLGLYDADSDDAGPYDDANATWLGQTLEWVLGKLRSRAHARGREVLCLFNAGFFNMGLDRGRVGSHVAPLVVNGKPLYNVRVLRPGEEGWTFGVSQEEGRWRFHLTDEFPWERLREFDTAVCWVRPLRVAGRSSPLAPGLGVTRLKCSRTSLGWTTDSRRLYLLVVRDPDGEAASVRQWKGGKKQTGGWDVADVQQFWERMGVPYALLLDGGDSTQLACLRSPRRYTTVRSAYHLAWTLAYWRGRPLRVFLPMLPAVQAHGGVMNYLYVEAPQRPR